MHAAGHHRRTGHRTVDAAGDPPPVPATIGPVAAVVSGRRYRLEIRIGAELAAIGGRGFAAAPVEALWPRDG